MNEEETVPPTDSKQDIKDESANSTGNSTFNENQPIVVNDQNDSVADVINKPVPITSSSEQPEKKAEENGEPMSIIYKLKQILSPVTSQFLKVGKFCQSQILKLSEKIQVQSSYKYFVIFLVIGLIILFFALFTIPFVIFSPGKLLRLLSFGNIMIMTSFFFFYGSKDFFAFLVDQNRTGVMFGHLLGVFSGLFVSLFIGGYFLQLVLDCVLCITTVMFILTLIPGGQGGISAIKRMLISPMMLLLNNFRGSISNNSNQSS
jgi:hypothetical protein